MYQSEDFMKKRSLRVSLDVKQPSIIELTVGEKVQLDRLVPSTDCYVAERHGDLIPAGVTTLALEQGLYAFKTLSAAHLKIVQGGVMTAVGNGTKSGWPDPPLSSGVGPLPFGGAGDEPSGEMPRLTVG
jgi:hypothetical protein